MPIDRSIAEGLAENVAELYRGAETRLAQNLARRIRADITSGHQDRLTAMSALRRQAEDVLAALSGRSARLAERALMEAYARGAAAAVDEMARLSGDRWVDWLARRSRIVRAIAWLTGYSKRRDARLAEAVAAVRADLPGIDSVMVIAQELTQRMSSTHLHVLRWHQDAYRDVMAGPVVDVLLGTKTRLRAAQVAWEHLLSKGVSGFTDKRGHRRELASYVEMATRTAVAHSSIEGHLGRLTQAGAELVIVSNAPEECRLCRPYESRVLAINGPAGPRVIEHAIEDGVMVPIDVKATVAEAVAAGLIHPNCRHRLAMYLPGVTKSETHTQDPKGDKDRQRLRELERELRALKLKREALVDPTAAAALDRKIRTKQAQIREHVRVSGAQRQPQREQVGSAR
ncbi:phage minor capsid protein [Glycomyces paridis]|uniref:Minor capsid protein n=1 Tax=Glycomyces paridis TaxID=2126555 RepID=A0A4S8P6V2_9ACTN|nr:phage minor capsid protein [Glycomyces paridis]THV26003.1 minor capsid protein [Glycomyces paridis]